MQNVRAKGFVILNEVLYTTIVQFTDLTDPWLFVRFKRPSQQLFCHVGTEPMLHGY